jgi:tripartite-type tricarboxylate transporter receptor subunit TctC
MLGKRIVCSAILMLACGLGAAGQTASYPARPIKVIVPFPPGGPVDVTARILTQHLPQTLGQPIVVETAPAPRGALEQRRSPAPTPTATRCYAGTSARSSCCLR